MEKNDKTKMGWGYFRELQNRRIDPNFWTSYDYYLLAGVQLKSDGNFLWAEVDGGLLSPPIGLGIREWDSNSFLADKRIWTDFSNYSFPEPRKFWDWEYLYRPRNFLTMEGRSFRAFRKNIKKVPERTGLPLTYRTVEDKEVDSCLKLLSAWVAGTGKDFQEIQELETIVEYLEKSRFKKGLWIGDKLVGVNIWDLNWRYINFRYSIFDPEVDFLSEYLRWKFYTDEEILNLHKNVNDGGTLNRSGLEWFKDRLCPIRKRKVYTRRAK